MKKTLVKDAGKTSAELKEEYSESVKRWLGDNSVEDLFLWVNEDGQEKRRDVETAIHLLSKKIRESWMFWFGKNSISQLLHIYIPSDCSNSQNYSDSLRSPLNTAVQDFLAHKEQKVLLILGDSGSGKTSLTLKFEEEYWNSGSEDQYIPIRIELRSFTKETIKTCVEETLKDRYKLLEKEIEQLKKNKDIRLIVLFDGYDEIGGRAEFNLYDQSRLRDWDCEVKVIITCRSQHFTGEEEFKKHFVLCQTQTNTKLNESLKLIYVAPFSEAQMNQYLVQYSEEHAKKKDTIQFPLKEIQELLETQIEFKTLLSNPFVLKIFSDVAPKLLEVTDTPKPEKTQKINRAKIYQSFLEDWFFRAKMKLEESIRVSELNKKPKDVERYFFGYAQRLAYAYFREGITELAYREVSSDEEEFEEYREIEEGNIAFKEFFGSEKAEVVEARKASPLRRSGDSTYSFVHKSFQDYLAGRHLYFVLRSGNKKLTLENWNKRYLSEDRAVLRFLSEIIEGDGEKKKLEERLLQIIKSSSQSEAIDTASSNAISVLNWNRYSFGGMDLHEIRIPKAYLEGVNFSGANLSASKLTGSYVRNSEWSEADLRGSDLSELEYGEYPDWEQGSKVECLVFNAAGTLLATGDNKGYLRLWRYPDGELLRRWKGHKREINSVSFSGDGKRLASGGDDKTIRIWDVERGLEERALLGHTDNVTSVGFSCDGKRLASGGGDETVRIWDVESGKEERRLKRHTGDVTIVSFSHDGKRLASGGWDRTIRIWDVESGLEERALLGHIGGMSLSFSRDGKRLASGGRDRTIRIWNVESGKEEPRLKGHTGSVTSVSFSRDGKRLASGGDDKTIRIWDVERGLEERALLGHTDNVTSVGFSCDGKRLASGGGDETVRIWDVESGLEERALLGHTNWVMSVSFSRDGQRLASGGLDETVRIWGVESGLEERALLGHTDTIRRVSWSRDGKRLASGGNDNTIRLWDVESGKEERRLKGHTGDVTSVSWSSDGKCLASGGHDSTIRIWDVESGLEERALLGHISVVTSVSWSCNGKRLASGGHDSTIRIWDVESGLEERALLGHTDTIRRVSWSRDGKRLASGGDDNTIRIWDVESGKEERALLGHTDSVSSVSWSSDGKRLASGGVDRTIRVWDVEDGKCTGVSVFNQIVRSVTFYKLERSQEEYLGAGIGNGVYVFSVEQNELNGKPRLILKWRTEYYLRAQNANLESAIIDNMNRRLLEQRGAKKSNPNHEATEEKNKSSKSSSQNLTQEDVTSFSHSPKQSQSNSTPTYLSSAMHGDFETMQSLYNPVMNVNFGNETNPPERRGVLHWACYHRNKKAVKFLLNQIADVNLLDVNKQTPLHLVLLPRYDAEKNQKSEDKKTRLAIFAKLLRHQARIDLKNSHNKTVIDLSEVLAFQNPIFEPEYLFLILIQNQNSQVVKLTKLIQSIFKIDFQAFKNDISSCLKDYKSPNSPDNQSNNKQLVNQILQNLLFIDKVEYNVFQYLAHLRDKGGMVTDARGKFISAVIDAPSNSEKIKVVFPKTENGWMQGQSFEGWNNIEFLVARMHIFIQIWLDYKKGFLQTDLNDGLKKVFEERLEREIYYGITACRIAQINKQFSQLAKDNPLKEKLKIVFNRILCQFISQLSEGHIFYYPTGNKAHSVYVNFKRLSNNQIGIWVDNVGDEHDNYGHTTINPEKKINPMNKKAEVTGHKKVLSCSLGKLNVSLFKEHAVDVEAYLKNLSKAETKPGKKGLDKVYILPSDLETEDYKPQFQPKRELTKGHCVLRNHNVGLLNRFFYRMPEETEDDSQKKPGRVLYRLIKEREETTLMRMK